MVMWVSELELELGGWLTSRRDRTLTIALTLSPGRYSTQHVDLLHASCSEDI